MNPMTSKPPRGMNRLGLRFLAAMLAVLGVAILMIAIAAQSMFINDHDLRLLMWALVPAVLGAAIVAVLMAHPVARDANRICDAAMRVADGDLTAHIVDGIQPREATGGQDHGWTPRPGDRRGDGSADKPGVAALGHDRDPGR